MDMCVRMCETKCERNYEKKYGRRYEKNDGAGTLGGVCVALFMCIIIGIVVEMLQPECFHKDCYNEPVENSKYCVLHELEYE